MWSAYLHELGQVFLADLIYGETQAKGNAVDLEDGEGERRDCSYRDHSYILLVSNTQKVGAKYLLSCQLNCPTTKTRRPTRAQSAVNVIAIRTALSQTMTVGCPGSIVSTVHVNST